jgi:hypothetical protein
MVARKDSETPVAKESKQKDMCANYLTPKEDRAAAGVQGAEDATYIEGVANDLSLPLLSPDQRNEAMDYGFSFNSKKMAMGPAFFNVRIICDCLGKALRRHIDFSQNEFWFLDELHKAKKERKAMIK